MPTMPPTEAAPMIVPFDAISGAAVLATFDIASFDATGAGATPPKAFAEATRARHRNFCSNSFNMAS